MRWSKKNKGLIKQVIDRYYWMLEKKSRMGDFLRWRCPLCPEYYCEEECPNVIISKMLNCDWGGRYKITCIDNAKYIGIRFRNDEPCMTQSNIKKRLQLWEDALALTKKKFTRKYKKGVKK